MSSLYRLIELAKRTGDRLIVHDSLNAQDTVIMSVDQYEDLLDGGAFVIPPEDDLPPSTHNDEIQAAGQILQDRYAEVADYFSYGDHEEEGPQEENFHIPQEQLEDYEHFVTESEKQKIEPIGEQEMTDPTVDEPQIESLRTNISKFQGGSSGQLEEEPLDNDEPVFYEEPV